MNFDSPQACLVRCLQDCATQASHCAEAAATVEDAHECAAACRDVAALCHLAAELVARQSDMAPLVLPTCELAAASCADACEEHLGAFFGECARQCRKLHEALDRVDPGRRAAPDSQSTERETPLTH